MGPAAKKIPRKKLSHCMPRSLLPMSWMRPSKIAARIAAGRPAKNQAKNGPAAQKIPRTHFRPVCRDFCFQCIGCAHQNMMRKTKRTFRADRCKNHKKMRASQKNHAKKLSLLKKTSAALSQRGVQKSYDSSTRITRKPNKHLAMSNHVRFLRSITRIPAEKKSIHTLIHSTFAHFMARYMPHASRKTTFRKATLAAKVGGSWRKFFESGETHKRKWRKWRKFYGLDLQV